MKAILQCIGHSHSIHLLRHSRLDLFPFSTPYSFHARIDRETPEEVWILRAYSILSYAHRPTRLAFIMTLRFIHRFRFLGFGSGGFRLLLGVGPFVSLIRAGFDGTDDGLPKTLKRVAKILSCLLPVITQ